MRPSRKLLTLQIDRPRVHLLPIGDIHYGSMFFSKEQEEKLDGYIAWALKKDALVLMMGDEMENATRRSPGGSVFEQSVKPQDQVDWVIEKFMPLAKRGLIVGKLTGNHEERTFNDTGLDPSKIIAAELGVPYFRYSILLRILVQKIPYEIYATHGRTAARYTHTKLAACMKLSGLAEADCYLMAHVHDLAVLSKERKIIDARKKVVTTRRVTYVLTGHFLDYDDSYAEAHNMEPGKGGSPRIRLDGTKKDLHVSV